MYSCSIWFDAFDFNLQVYFTRMVSQRHILRSTSTVLEYTGTVLAPKPAKMREALVLVLLALLVDRASAHGAMVMAAMVELNEPWALSSRCS